MIAVESFVDLHQVLMDNATEWQLQNYDATSSVKYPNDCDDEIRRLKNLYSYHVLDSDDNIPAFDVLTKEATKVFNVPIARICFVDSTRQVFKANTSKDADTLTQTGRRISFCSHAIRQRNAILVVPDATQDGRFQDSPLVQGENGIKFYAGASIITPEGERIGVFTIQDHKPHPEGLTQYQIQQLQQFASETVFELIEHYEANH